MNRKGFTLVELIGIIVLLSLIVIVAYSSFAKQLKVAKEDAYNRQITTIVSAAKDYHLENPDEEGVMLVTLGNSGLLSTKDLKNPRDNSVMSGCVEFTRNSYGQIEYVYITNLQECSNKNID